MSNETRKAKTEVTEVAQKEGSLLDQVITETRIGRNEEQRAESRRQIATLVEEVMSGTVRIAKDLETTISARIADIDQLLTVQLNEIMHASEFQKLEASWRGLHYLVSQSETSTMLKIRVMNASKEDLRKDLDQRWHAGPGRVCPGWRGRGPRGPALEASISDPVGPVAPHHAQWSRRMRGRQ